MSDHAPVSLEQLLAQVLLAYDELGRVPLTQANEVRQQLRAAFRRVRTGDPGASGALPFPQVPLGTPSPDTRVYVQPELGAPWAPVLGSPVAVGQVVVAGGRYLLLGARWARAWLYRFGPTAKTALANLASKAARVLELVGPAARGLSQAAQRLYQSAWMLLTATAHKGVQKIAQGAKATLAAARSAARRVWPGASVVAATAAGAAAGAAGATGGKELGKGLAWAAGIVLAAWGLSELAQGGALRLPWRRKRG